MSRVATRYDKLFGYQVWYDFGVRFSRELDPVLLKLVSQFAKALYDPIVNDRNHFRRVRIGVIFSWSTVCYPSSGAAQWCVRKFGLQIFDAFSPVARKHALLGGCNACRIIAAALEPSPRFYELRRDRLRADNADKFRTLWPSQLVIVGIRLIANRDVKRRLSPKLSRHFRPLHAQTEAF